MTKHPLKDITFVHCTEKPHVFPSETSDIFSFSFIFLSYTEFLYEIRFYSCNQTIYILLLLYIHSHSTFLCDSIFVYIIPAVIPGLSGPSLMLWQTEIEWKIWFPRTYLASSSAIAKLHRFWVRGCTYNFYCLLYVMCNFVHSSFVLV